MHVIASNFCSKVKRNKNYIDTVDIYIHPMTLRNTNNNNNNNCMRGAEPSQKRKYLISFSIVDDKKYILEIFSL